MSCFNPGSIRIRRRGAASNSGIVIDRSTVHGRPPSKRQGHGITGGSAPRGRPAVRPAAKRGSISRPCLAIRSMLRNRTPALSSPARGPSASRPTASEAWQRANPIDEIPQVTDTAPLRAVHTGAPSTGTVRGSGAIIDLIGIWTVRSVRRRTCLARSPTLALAIPGSERRQITMANAASGAAPRVGDAVLS